MQLRALKFRGKRIHRGNTPHTKTLEKSLQNLLPVLHLLNATDQIMKLKMS